MRRFLSSSVAVGLMLLPGLAMAGAKIEISEDRWVTIGAGVRTSFAAVEDGAPSGSDYSTDTELESFRFYSGGQLFKYMSVEFNAEYESFTNEVVVLDGVVKFEYSDMLNIWAGRFLPPSDRANLSGPYYLNGFDFPFVQQFSPIFAGRDEGVAYWGQIGEGMFKWQLGFFQGFEGAFNDEDELLYSGRVVLNLLDPEPGYYNSSTFYGDKDVFAIGFTAMTQDDGGGRVSVTPSNLQVMQDLNGNLNIVETGNQTIIQQGDFSAWNIDVLFEKNLGDSGVFTAEAAFYDYDLDDQGTTSNEGQGYFAVLSYLLPGEFGVEGLKGRLQPLVRYQEFDPEASGADEHTRWEFGLNWILDGHNARLAVLFARDEDSPTGIPGLELDDRNIFKIGLQIQL